MRLAAIFAAWIVGIFLFWEVQSAGADIKFHKGDLPGYYNYLAQGLTAGHLYVPVQPSPELLAKPNPWDPAIDNSLKMWDMALYNRRYYLYHGIGPALLAFVPYRLITGYDLPENFANWLFAFAGYLFSLGTLLCLMKLAKLNPAPWKAFFAFLALGLCTNLPFLLSRTWVYEIAIAGGYFCVSAGLFFLVRGWNIPAGFFLGMAVACRPHLGLIGALAAVMLVGQRRRVIGFLAPFALVGLGLCVYNYERFENPLQFGNKYILGNADQNEVRWGLAKTTRGLRFLTMRKPVINPVFPWFYPAQRPAELPVEEAYEPLVGGLWMAPFIVFVLMGVRAGPVRPYWILLLVSGFGILFFIAGTGWSVQRYETDFLPLFVMAALLSAMTEWTSGMAMVLIIPGIVVSLVFGFHGPYDEMAATRPVRYFRIARAFSPIGKYRPQMNPRIERTFIREENRPEGTRDVLVGAGPGAARYELRFEQRQGKPTLISQFSRFSEQWITQELPPSNGPRELRVLYDPATRTLTVHQNGVLVLSQKIEWLMSTPSQIYLGERKL